MNDREKLTYVLIHLNGVILSLNIILRATLNPGSLLKLFLSFIIKSNSKVTDENVKI